MNLKVRLSVRQACSHALHSIKRDLHLLKSLPPGRRFRDFHRSKREQVRKGTLRGKLITIGMGSLLVAFGLGIGWLPGPGGFLAILGLAILIPYVPGMAGAMDKIEGWVRKCARAVRRIWQAA